MFAKTIVDSDSFLDMPLSTQAVYFHLSMRADDEGFINNPKKILRMVGASEDEIKLLIAKRFILDMDDGIVVVKHWRVHNYIQKDRFKPTVHTEKREKIGIRDNNVYTLDTECIHVVRVGKDSIGKDSKAKARVFKKPTIEEVSTYIREKDLNVDANEFFEYFETGNWIDAKGNKVKNWKQKVLTWHKHSKTVTVEEDHDWSKYAK